MLKFKYHFNQLSSSTSVDQLSSSTSVDKAGDGSDSVEEVNRIAINTRERKEPKVRSTGALSPDVIKEQSRIFGKGKNKSIHLSSWQKAVNKAAFVLAQESPDCMYNQGQLKLHAEEEARKTYVFKRPRSKFDQEDPNLIRKGNRQTGQNFLVSRGIKKLKFAPLNSTHSPNGLMKHRSNFLELGRQRILRNVPSCTKNIGCCRMKDRRLKQSWPCYIANKLGISSMLQKRHAMKHRAQQVKQNHWKTSATSLGKIRLLECQSLQSVSL